MISSKIAKASYYRNFVFGVEDSLVSTVGLLSGITIAGVDSKTVLATGVILIFVEAISMGAGSFLSESSAETYENHVEKPTNRSYLDALIMFISYLLSGCIPLLPYIIFSQDIAFWGSVIVSLLVLFVLGVINAKISGTRVWKSVMRMVLIGGSAIAIGSIIGRLF